MLEVGATGEGGSTAWPGVGLGVGDVVGAQEADTSKRLMEITANSSDFFIPYSRIY